MGEPAAVSLEPGVSALVIENVSRIFPGVRRGAATRALEPTSLEVPDNDFVTILGPSGCGKSTLLRLVAGLDRPTTGRIILNGKPVIGPGPVGHEHECHSQRGFSEVAPCAIGGSSRSRLGHGLQPRQRHAGAYASQ